MSPRNTVMIGVVGLVLISMSQKSGTMVQGIQTSSAINAQRTELINTGKEQRELGKAQSDLAIRRFQGNCRLVDQSIDGVMARQDFFEEGALAPRFNIGDVVCNTLGATGEIVAGPDGMPIVAKPASVSAIDRHKIQEIVQKMEEPYTLQ